METLSHFYCIEGIDGSGKTSIALELSQLDSNIITGFEPTKNEYGLKIRDVLSKKITISNQELLNLFIKDRAVNQIWIENQTENGKIVVLDRYILSTMAYQGLNFELRYLFQLNAGFYKPAMTFFLDVPPSIALERKLEQLDESKHQSELFETLEQQKKIYQNYLDSLVIFEQNHYSVKIIDGILRLDDSVKSKSVNQMVQEIYDDIKENERQFL